MGIMLCLLHTWSKQYSLLLLNSMVISERETAVLVPNIVWSYINSFVPSVLHIQTHHLLLEGEYIYCHHSSYLQTGNTHPLYKILHTAVHDSVQIDS